MKTNRERVCVWTSWEHKQKRERVDWRSKQINSEEGENPNPTQTNNHIATYNEIQRMTEWF